MRIAICDDQKYYRDRVRSYLQEYIEIYPEITISEFSSGENLIKSYNEEERFDVLFLDIQMKDVNGVQTAEKIRTVDKNIIIFFISSYINFVADTFRVGAFQFLMKPIQQDDFKRDFERAMEQYKINNYKYVVKYKGNVAKLSIQDIIYIEAFNRHLFICDGKNKYECVGKLADEEKKLGHYNFIRCHQGFLVNMAHIRVINKSTIILKNEAEIPISKRLKADVMNAFNKYVTRYII